MNDEKFWMVWNPTREAPSHRHDSELSAVREAERLAEKCPGQSFYVLEALSLRKVESPMQRIRLTDSIPF